MKFRIGILTLMFIALIAISLCCSAAETQTSPIAKVLVWVRDARGAPVTGLTADDFAVTENGIPDRVVGLEKFFSGTPIQSQNASSATGSISNIDHNAGESAEAVTQILVVLAPMPAAERNHAIADALRFFSERPAANWNVGLVDDEGNALRYSQDFDQLRAALKRLEKHYALHARNSAWYGGTQRAIRELGVLPGRHVIVLISSRSGMPPSSLIELAVSSQAAMYTIESHGPAVAVPFGGAGEISNPEAGPIPLVTGEFAAEALSGVLANLHYTDTGLGQFLPAAEETGGISAENIKDAFDHISADAAGYYLISFQARPQVRDGTWNALAISVKRPRLNVTGPRYYMVPLDAGTEQMPAEMKTALESARNRTGLSLVADSWLFPDQGGVHRGVFAAEVHWDAGTPQPGSRVKIHAELINDSMHGLSGSWFEEKPWPAQGEGIHWQSEARIYPGSYLLRVTAMDTASGKIASGNTTFMARPLDVPAFRFSGIVLADACLPSSERAAARQSIFDPLLWEGCKLAPAAGARFRSKDNPRILLHIYPPGEKFSRLVVMQWKAYAVVDDALDKAIELTITPAEVRGLTVSGILPLNRFDLAPGNHRLTVLFVVPDHNSTSQKIPLQTEFSIEP